VTDTAGAQRQRSVLLPALFTLFVVAGLISLGSWQIERKAWKEALIATLVERLAAPPAPLPPQAQWPRLSQADDEFRRVTFTAAFPPGEEARVYTSGSAFRPDVSGPGYWIFAPARLPDGGVVVVDRGFLPEGAQAPAAGAEPIELTGVLRWPEASGLFTPKEEPARNLWFARDHRAIAAAKGWGEVAPFYVDLESPPPPGGLLRPGPLTVNLRNEHLQYAITWFGLALVVTAGFAFWLRSRRPEAAISAPRSR
jgi:cytochrome oxidase assembly protein ShyY1